MLCRVAASAQTIPVSGVVADRTGSPLVGVTVLIQGTNTGAITDGAGAYSLNAPSAASVLTFTFLGYVPVEETVGTRRQINVTMEQDVQTLSDVVVVGYGTRRAGEITGSISTVSSEEISKIPAVNPGELLRNVPGVTIMQSNTPGDEPTVRIRGVGTMNDSSPLWVVDGIPGAPVNPNNIETITILKDAAASAIYGTRAANGVVLVTTKAGRKNQKASVSFNLRTGIVNNVTHYDLLNTREYGEMLWLQYKNDGLTERVHPLYGTFTNNNGVISQPVIPDYIYPVGAKEGDPNVNPDLYDYGLPSEDGNETYLITRANKIGTDWVREIERTGKFQDISMNVSGGGENSAYSLQMGYLNQQGVLKWTGFNRWNIQANVTSDVTKWMQVGGTLSTTYNEQQGLISNNNEESAISWAYRLQPIIPVYDIGGNYAGTRGGGQVGNSRNPVGILYDARDDLRKTTRTAGSGWLKIAPIEGLSVKSLFGFSLRSYDMKDINRIDKSWSERQSNDYVYRTEQFEKQWNWTNTVDYGKTIGRHNFTVLLGTEAVANDRTQVTANRYQYSFKDSDYMDLSTGIGGQANNSDLSDWSLFSIFGRVNYSLDNKYLLEAVVRHDGSSRFGGNNKFGTFPAFSLAWRMSEENFMESTRGWLDSFKLRGGWGVTGNDRMRSNYNSYSTYSSQLGAATTHYPYNGANTTGTLGFRQDQIGNTSVKWETTKTLNIGFDATLFKGLTVVFDVWQRRTTDMLYNKANPAVAGKASPPWINAGEMLNRGFDVDVTYRGTAAAGEFEYSVNVNVSRYKNKLVKLSGAAGEILEGSMYRDAYYTRAQTGTAFPEFFGYIVDGIFQTQAEADAWAEYGTYNKPGHYKFRDVDGDGNIDSDDRTYIGSPHPKFTGGLNINMEYKSFDLSAQFIGSYGNKMVNFARRWMDFVQYEGNRSHDRLYNSWGSDHLSDWSKAKLPITESNDSASQQPSSAFVEDASYLRLRNLMLGYNFSGLLNLPSTASLRVYAQVTNLFTLTRYSGLDPEVNINNAASGGAANMGVDAGAWPTPRQIMFGVSVGF
jgi:TonB-linked SusC/RagA family outer membrane protein